MTPVLLNKATKNSKTRIESSCAFLLVITKQKLPKRLALRCELYTCCLWTALLAVSNQNPVFPFVSYLISCVTDNTVGHVMILVCCQLWSHTIQVEAYRSHTSCQTVSALCGLSRHCDNRYNRKPVVRCR